MQNAFAYLEQRFGPEAAAEVKQAAKQPVALWNQPPQAPPPVQPPQQLPTDLRIADMTPQEFDAYQRSIIRGELTAVQQQTRLEAVLLQERQVVGGMVGEAIKNYGLSEDEAKSVMQEASSLFDPSEFQQPGQLTKYGRVFAQIAYNKKLEALALSGYSGTATQVQNATQQLGQTVLPPGAPAPPAPQKTPAQIELERLRNAVEPNRVNNITSFVRGSTS